jgi:hypothetical protein
MGPISVTLQLTRKALPETNTSLLDYITAIFGLSQTIMSISNHIDTNSDQILIFSPVNYSFLTVNIFSKIG